MKKLLFVVFATLFMTSCIDIVRGYKSVTIIKIGDKSAAIYTDAPNLSVDADKQYSDLLKAALPEEKPAATKTKPVQPAQPAPSAEGK